MGEIQPTSTRPTNISQRPNPDGTIYVETAMPPPLTTSDSNGSNPSHPSQGQSLSHPDLAGVLRRNQACLNCRRRKLVSRLDSFFPPVGSDGDCTDGLCRNATRRDHIAGLVSEATDTRSGPHLNRTQSWRANTTTRAVTHPRAPVPVPAGWEYRMDPERA